MHLPPSKIVSSKTATLLLCMKFSDQKKRKSTSPFESMITERNFYILHYYLSRRINEYSMCHPCLHDFDREKKRRVSWRVISSLHNEKKKEMEWRLPS